MMMEQLTERTSLRGLVRNFTTSVCVCVCLRAHTRVCVREKEIEKREVEE